jgi:hypothetical protein
LRFLEKKLYTYSNRFTSMLFIFMIQQIIHENLTQKYLTIHIFSHQCSEILFR